jgi:hypothetical protein
MTLVVLTIAVITLIVAALAVSLFTIGGLLNRTADNLDDCEQSEVWVTWMRDDDTDGARNLISTPSATHS